MAVNVAQPILSKQFSYNKIISKPAHDPHKFPRVASKCTIRIKVLRGLNASDIDCFDLGVAIDTEAEVEIGDSDSVCRDLLDKFLCEMNEGEVSNMVLYETAENQPSLQENSGAVCHQVGFNGKANSARSNSASSVGTEQTSSGSPNLSVKCDEDQVMEATDCLEQAEFNKCTHPAHWEKCCSTESMTAKPSLLELEVSLLSCSVVLEIWKMSPEQKLNLAKNHKLKGNEMFQMGNIERAFMRFSKAAKYIVAMGEEGKISQDLLTDWRTLKCQCYLNISMCQLKYQNYDAVISNCTKALEMDRSSVKGLFRRGQAYLNLKQYYLAEADFSGALTLEPGNKAVEKNLVFTQNILKKSDQNLAQAMSKMFK